MDTSQVNSRGHSPVLQHQQQRSLSPVGAPNVMQLSSIQNNIQNNPQGNIQNGLQSNIQNNIQSTIQSNLNTSQQVVNLNNRVLNTGNTLSYSMVSTPDRGGSSGQKDGNEYSENIVDIIQKNNEGVWSRMASLYMKMQKYADAQAIYEKILTHTNPNSKRALYFDSILNMSLHPENSINSITKIASIRNEMFQSTRNLMEMELNYKEWVVMGFAFLQLQHQEANSQAFDAFKKAIQVWELEHGQEECHDPVLWYGIGIFYEKCDSLNNAEEAFGMIIRLNPQFKRISEVFFRLALIFKRLRRYGEAVDCFVRILDNPPAPLTKCDIWLQIAHVYEINGEWNDAKRTYEESLVADNGNAKANQQYGWFLQNEISPFYNIEQSIYFIKRSIDINQNDAMSWYLLGRCFMKKKNYQLAYSAYQQAVSKDKTNPHLWSSIGILYYQLGQYGDAIGAYTTAIQLDDSIYQIWQNLGSLYESIGKIDLAKDAFSNASNLLENKGNIQNQSPSSFGNNSSITRTNLNSTSQSIPYEQTLDQSIPIKQTYPQQQSSLVTQNQSPSLQISTGSNIQNTLPASSSSNNLVEALPSNNVETRKRKRSNSPTTDYNETKVPRLSEEIQKVSQSSQEIDNTNHQDKDEPLENSTQLITETSQDTSIEQDSVEVKEKDKANLEQSVESKIQEQNEEKIEASTTGTTTNETQKEDKKEHEDQVVEDDELVIDEES